MPGAGARRGSQAGRAARSRRFALAVLAASVALLGWTTASIALIAQGSHAAAASTVLSEDDPGGGDSGGGGADTGSGGGDSGSGGGEGASANDPEPSSEPASDPAQEPASEPAEEPSAAASESPASDLDEDRSDSSPDPSRSATDRESEAPEEQSSPEASDPATEESDPGLEDPAAEESDPGLEDPAAEESDPSLEDPAAEESEAGAEDSTQVVDPDSGTTSTITAGGELSLRVAAQPGEDVQAAVVEVTGSGLAVQARYELWIFSSPQLAATGFTDAMGSFAASASLPAVGPGSHTVVLRSTGADGQPIETASGLSIGPDGAILAIELGVDASTLVAPALPASPKAPAYTPVKALDQPAAVVVTAIAGLTIASAIGASVASGLAMGESGSGEARSKDDAGTGRQRSGSGEGDQSEGSVEGEVRAMQDDFEDAEVETVRSRGLRTRFTPTGEAPGDTSALHRTPGTHLVDGVAYAGVLLAAPRSPLMARAIADAAPVRAMIGSLSMILPLAAIGLGVASVVMQDGVAQPPVLAILIPLLVIGVLDALAGLLGWLAFALGVVLQGGIVGWESVRTLLGLALLIVGPALIASSFREVRRPPGSAADPWERLVDFVVVPLLGGWAGMNIALALPSLGGAAFPISERANLVGLTIMIGLVAKVALEEAAARWFPERMAAVLPRRTASPGASQRVASALLRTAVFLFVSAAFVGNVWQLWVAGALFLIPALLAPLANRLPNNSRLWQALPDGVPKVGVLLLVSWAISSLALTELGDSPAYAQVAFVVLAIPGFILSILGLVARGPRGQDVRWYRRPSMTWLYRIGGVAVLLATAWLAVNV